jgi:hypothetical protein
MARNPSPGNRSRPQVGFTGPRLPVDSLGQRFSRSATDGPRSVVKVQHRFVNSGAACTLFDEERQFGLPTGHSSPANSDDCNGGAQHVRGLAGSRSSARLDLISGFGAFALNGGFDFPKEKPENRTCREAPVPVKACCPREAMSDLCGLSRRAQPFLVSAHLMVKAARRGSR